MGRAADRADLQRRHFEGKVAIVTGAASGIGKALATELVDRGATVVVSDIAGQEAALVAERLDRRAGTGRAVAATLDVTDPDAVEALVARTAAEHGGIDLLFNNAGIGVGGEVRELSAAHWRRVIDVNLWSVINGVNAAYPRMIAQGRGHIVNTASLSGLLPSPMLVPYSTTKHAVVGLSVGLRMEAAAHGVKVTVVCPGVIETPLLDKPNPEDLPPVSSMPNIRSMLTSLVGPPYPVASLAADVLDGVALNRPIIVTPFHARRAWAVYRISPRLLIDQGAKRLRGALGPGA
ncbi:MAG TPA: SDR family oxidoreductase [Acidimicrobiales bacterium]|jgi:NAD(P)-dependent dehydrogenase (short-subunit alcohol dehydrogenase family)|nr:SDR family oxidoreductase [Acidimicrobiales bacterium]